MKYIIVTGGVLSGIGKGITSSSTGLLLQRAGYKVTAVKIDPYLNVDAGTMNPYEHGEVFVMTDGSEVDLDLGNYERFLSCNLTKDHNITTGKVFKNVIEKERRGDYLGQTVQIIPHVVREIVDSVAPNRAFPADPANELNCETYYFDTQGIEPHRVCKEKSKSTDLESVND